MYELGTLPPDKESLTVGRKPYVFIFSTGMSIDDVNSAIAGLSDFADNISAVIGSEGGGTVVVTLTPKIQVTFLAWEQLFSNIGLSNMTDAYIGTYTPQADTGFHPIDNIENYYGPSVSSAWQSIKDAASKATAPLGDALKYIEIVAVAAAVITGGVLIMRYLPAPKKSETAS